MLAERHSLNCTAFITVWMISFSSRVSFHFFMIFCRQVKHAFLFLKSWSRFTYVCYASGLLKEGLSLLHWLTMILMTLLCINTTIVYPLRFMFYVLLLHLTIKYCCTLRHAFNGNNFQDILKGRICTETNISTIIKGSLFHHVNTIEFKLKI